MEIVAKKFREQYVREAIYPDVKIYLNSLRERTLDDTLQNLHILILFGPAYFFAFLNQNKIRVILFYFKIYLNLFV